MRTNIRLGTIGLALVGTMGTAMQADAYSCDAELSECATAFGNGVTAGGNSQGAGVYSVAMGYSSYAAGDYAIAAGDACRTEGDYAIAMGDGCHADGRASVAMGSASVASGVESIAMGWGDLAGGAWAIAMGETCTASEDNSIAIGYRSEASGTGSVAMGYQSEATGNSSFATNQGVASGHASTAIGAVEAQALWSIVVGKWNVTSDTYDPDNWVYTDPLFVVGNGRAPDDQNNALTILKNGNMGINSQAPEYPLHVKGGADAKLGEGGYVVVGNTGSENIAIDTNEIMARSNGAASTLYLNADGGEVQVGAKLRIGSIATGSTSYTLCSSGSGSGNVQRCASSSRRYKENIVDFTLGLAEVERLRPVSFTYRDSNQHSFGFIAEEVAEIYPDFAIYDEQGRPESVRYPEMTALLANAVQELNAEKQELATTVKRQAAALDDQAAQLKAQAVELAELRAGLAKQQQMLDALAANVARLSR
jgi:hypothetical protein